MHDRPRICVVGSLNLDLVARVARLPLPGETIAASDVQTIPGGKGANQAVACARLGASVQMIGRVGDDDYGRLLLENLASENVDCSGVSAIADSPTGMAFINVDGKGENTIVVSAGANGALSADDVQAARDAIAGADLLLVQCESPFGVVRAAIEIANSSGAKVLFNPAPAPPACEVTDAFLRVHLLCLNETEAYVFSGKAIESPTDAERSARALQARGAAAVAITLGRRGALVLDTGGECEHVPGFPVEAVDATAAGDAFVGALAVRLAEGASLGKAARFACAAGAIAATRLGAQPSLPRREEVLSLLSKTSEA